MPTKLYTTLKYEDYNLFKVIPEHNNLKCLKILPIYLHPYAVCCEFIEILIKLNFIHSINSKIISRRVMNLDKRMMNLYGRGMEIILEILPGGK